MLPVALRQVERSNPAPMTGSTQRASREPNRGSTEQEPRLPDGLVTVTGAAGFLGSHVVEELLARRHRVLAVDDLSSGSLDNLAAARTNPLLSVLIGSVAEKAIAARAAAATSVFHLAGVVGVQRLAQRPVDVMHGNLRCTEVMLEASAQTGARILIASSSEVYGDGPSPFDESAAVNPGSADNLRGGYACAKAMGEWLAHAHARQHGLHAVVARLFNVVGPRQSGAYGMVLPRFVQQALAGDPITVFGDGSQTRCFAAVREVAAALCDLLAAPLAIGATCNVGSDREVSVLQLAHLVKGATRSASPVVLVPHDRVFPPGFTDPQRRVPSLDRLRSIVGWTPSKSIEAIVEDLCGEPASEPVQRALAARAV